MRTHAGMPSFLCGCLRFSKRYAIFAAYFFPALSQEKRTITILEYMTFANPLFLIGLVAVLVPIVIHLFNFRRYKTVYFSNVKMLEDIKRKTRREQTVQQLVVLALRILGIAALVLAFAQPAIAPKEQTGKKGNLITVFLDNSYSMETGTENSSLLYDAVDAAKSIVASFGLTDDFVLTTQDFSGEETHVLNRDQMLEMLDRVKVSPKSHSLRDIITFEQNTCSRSVKDNVIHYYISDFQKNAFDLNVLQDSNARAFLVPMPVSERSNVGVDSVWFLSPLFRTGSQVTLVARIHNYGSSDIEMLPVKLYLQDKQKAIAAVDIKAGTTLDCQLTYTIDGTGIQCGRVTIEDAPVTFDNEMFFTYSVSENTQVATISGNGSNRFLQALYGKDSVFNYLEMPLKQINYTQLKNSQVVVMDEVQTLSTGLMEEITAFVKSGGTLVVLPAKEMDKCWQQLFASLGTGNYGTLHKKELKCGSINMESQYFKNVLENRHDHLDMPTTLQHYSIQGGGSQGSETLMMLEDGTPLLTVFQVEKGKVILSAVAMNDDYGNVHRHALFFVPMHNIGIMSVMQDKLYNVIGKDQMQTVMIEGGTGGSVLSLKARGSKEEFIPEQRAVGNETALFFHDQISGSGFYDLVRDGAVCGTLAFNFDRQESDLDFYDDKALRKMAKSADSKVEVIPSGTKNIAKNVTDTLHGKQLWLYFVIFSLLCFLAEIALLRFWGRPKINNNENLKS